MRCNCGCNCEGHWKVPAVSLPVYSITFGNENNKHFAQSPIPRHRLVSNLPLPCRITRTEDHDCGTDVFVMIALWTVTLFFLFACIILTYDNYRLRKKVALKDFQKDVEF